MEIEPMTLEELKADVAKHNPALLHTFEWESHPESWDHGCYCAECRSEMDD